MAPIISTEKPAFADSAVQPTPLAVPATPPPLPAVPEAAVAPLDYQLEPKPVSRRTYRRVLWLCGAGWLALTIIVLSYGVWRARMIAPVAVAPMKVTLPVKPTLPMVTYTASTVVIDDRQQRGDRIKDLMTGGTRAATTVVYEEDPVAAGKLLPSPSEYKVANPSQNGTSAAQGYQPPAYIPALNVESNGRMKSTENAPAELFRGALTSPAGNRRLVRIALLLRYGNSNRPVDRSEPRPHQVISLARQFWFEIYRPSSDDWLTQVRGGESLKIAQPKGEDIPIRWVDGVLRADRAAEHNVRFYAGQLDAKDPSHFTIDYELNGARNVIDGWLTDDDYLRIRPRGGKVIGGDWRIDEKP